MPTLTNSLAELYAKKESADYAYHTLDDPLMSDADYDALCREIVASGGTLKGVGAAADGRFEKFIHHTPMMSLDNAFTDEDVARWVKSVAPAKHISVQRKLDGLSLTLIYQFGKLKTAATRGDGTVGEDVTAQAREVDGIPHELIGAAAKEHIVEVRGEVVMSKKVFRELNENLESQGKKAFANPRNAAAGSLRQKDPKVTRSRGLMFIAFGVTADTFRGCVSDTTCLEGLSDAGFQHVEHPTMVVHERVVDTLVSIHGAMISARNALDFDIDGMVYKVDSRNSRKDLGETSRTPRWAIAHKFPAERAVTILEGVDWQVGRTGIIAPVARLQAVNVGGVMVSNATLHNWDEIIRLGVRPGLKVEVQRAGDVIPQITGIIDGSYPTGHIELPRECPSCGSEVIRQDAYLRCTAGKDCDAQFLGFLEHFVSRDAMNIDGLGPSQIEDLFDQGWIGDASDIMDLPERVVPYPSNPDENSTAAEALAELPGWGKTSVKKLMTAITKAQKVELHKFIYALGIPQIGETTAKDLAKWCGSVDTFFNAAQEVGGFEGFRQVSGIGEATISALEAHWTDYHLDEALRLRRICEIAEPKQTASGDAQVFAGMTLVFTGGLDRWPRDTAALIVEELGGKVTNKVTKKTSVLVAGSNVGKVKTDDARNIGVEVWSEGDFIARVEEAISLGYILDILE